MKLKPSHVSTVILAIAAFLIAPKACSQITNRLTPTNQAAITMPRDPALDRPVHQPMAAVGSNAPVRLQSAQPQPPQPTYVDGLKWMFIACRRNPDVQDANVLAAIATDLWKQSVAGQQAQPKQAAAQP